MAQNKVLFTKKAVSDLTEIWNLTVLEWSEQQADEYYSSLVFCCSKLLGGAYILSKPYDKIYEGLKGLKCGHHVIFYRCLPSGDILIVRILHEKMDLKRHL